MASLGERVDRGIKAAGSFAHRAWSAAIHGLCTAVWRGARLRRRTVRAIAPRLLGRLMARLPAKKPKFNNCMDCGKVIRLCCITAVCCECIAPSLEMVLCMFCRRHIDELDDGHAPGCRNG